MMSNEYSKLPRIYCDLDLVLDQEIALDAGQVHYFRSVLRRQVNDEFRVFNARQGEFLARFIVLEKKKAVAVVFKPIQNQPMAMRQIHLFFSPIKKQRMDFLIEKAVELGVTDIHPVVMHRSAVRKVNAARLQAQITEALEQCERLIRPKLHSISSFDAKMRSIPDEIDLYAALERADTKPLKKIKISKNIGFVIGPEGGFGDNEIVYLTGNKSILPVSLGKSIYRAETACIICLAYAETFG